ncbi:MAG TPA: long-chain fatty acid--CoA ligase [Kofleriaceae bacterium]|nr:long-chain fatty acid--CoA ligase [Kofleriaceae bacterium]
MSITAPEKLVRRTKSIPELFLRRIVESADREAFRYPAGSGWRSMTWRQAGERVRAIAGGLLAFGLGREARAGILCNTRLEWVLVDLGVLCAGGATTTVYPSSTPEECAFILSDSGSEIAFVEDVAQLAKLRAQRAAMPSLKKIVLIDGAPDAADRDWVITLADLELRGAEWLASHPRGIEDVVAAIDGEQLATLIYTSGTTGRPKGVRLVHECWAYTADAIDALALMRRDDVQYLWLPLSHSFGKVLLGGQLACGCASAVDGRVPKLIDNLAVVRPTFMAAAPRIFEKAYNRIVSQAKEGSPIKARIFEGAVAVGKMISTALQAGEKPPIYLEAARRVADKLVFEKIKNRFGGKLRFFVSGSAPLARDIAEFFHACGILILEGYGLTETSAASFVNRPNKYKFGTVGQPLPGTEVKLDPADGEILIKSPGVMRGYHNLPEQTAEVLTADGWLRTGDIGEIDPGGFLRITDRKKDLIKTSGGKYIAPQHIEGKLKTICPYVSQVIVHGDKRNFVTALVTLDEEAVKPLLGVNGHARTYAEFVTSKDAQALLQPYIDELNKELAKYETVKKFAVLPKDLTVEEGDLTPSLKVKRKAVEKKYAKVLDSLYEGTVADL